MYYFQSPSTLIILYFFFFSFFHFYFLFRFSEQQLICLALQIIANLSMNPCHHAKLIDADLADCLMQLILPSDEWFYTNHSTKYAKFVKHHAARIMVYLGLEKRLRNKVYLFDLMGN